jgi:hypothetical protein
VVIHGSQITFAQTIIAAVLGRGLHGGDFRNPHRLLLPHEYAVFHQARYEKNIQKPRYSSLCRATHFTKISVVPGSEF